MTRVAVFIDYQNVYMEARNAFAWGSANHVDGQVDPLKVGGVIAGLRSPIRRLTAVRVYRGMPSTKQDRRRTQLAPRGGDQRRRRQPSGPLPDRSDNPSFGGRWATRTGAGGRSDRAHCPASASASLAKAGLLARHVGLHSLEMNFDTLVAEGESVPVEGWDFSWFKGRATEQRPSWGYARLLSGRLSEVRSALDIQTGGGEVFAWALGPGAQRRRQLAATESWPPNAAIPRARLSELGALVVRVADDEALPFVDEAFESVSSRHPVEVMWEEIARVLQPGGAYLSQMVGAGSNRELYEYMMGPQPSDPSRSPEAAVAAAETAGLHVVDLQEESLEVVFFDIGAVVHFLRKVLWTVPDFTVER